MIWGISKFPLQTWSIGSAQERNFAHQVSYHLPGGLLVLIKINRLYLNVLKKLNDPKRYQPTNYFTA